MSNAVAGAMPNNTPGRYDRMIKDLLQQINELRAARTLENATIGAGGLTVTGAARVLFSGGGSLLMQDFAGRAFLYAGGFTTNGFGMTLTRLDGSTALLFSDNDPVNESVQFISLLDRGGKPIVAEDSSGAGASWPLVPIQFEDLTWSQWAYNTTASFVAVQQAVHYKSSPRIYFTGQAICDGTAAGEVRLMCNGTQIGSTVTVPNLTLWNTSFSTPAGLPGNIQDALTLTLETRVTSGAGKCYAKALTAMAWGS